MNMKNATRISHMLLQFFPDFMFLSNRFYANNKERIGSSWIFCRKKYTRLYNTYDRVELSAPAPVSVSDTAQAADSSTQKQA